MGVTSAPGARSQFIGSWGEALRPLRCGRDVAVPSSRPTGCSPLTLGAPARILVLAPHTDDGEFGAGASVARWTREGREVHYVAFSACQTSVPDGWPEDILVSEVKRATIELGIGPERLRVLEFDVRRFARDRQEVLQSMVELNQQLAPDLVLIPSVTDLHQDHHTVATEALRAFKQTSILSYEMPWNNVTFTTQCFVHLSAADVEAKVRALGCYESQASRHYSDADYIRAQVRFRGTQIGVNHAEAFEVVRWVMR